MRKKEEKYDEDYYQDFCGEKHDYDVLRTLRRALRFSAICLPPNPKVIVFAFGNLHHYSKWFRLFSGGVIGYDINHTLIENAQKLNLPIYFQDVTTPFDIPRAHVVANYYLLEHLPDTTIVGCIDNAIKAAPVNVYKITVSDDAERYNSDPTHCNPKTHGGWMKFLDAVYKSRGWKRFYSAGSFGRLGYCQNAFYERFSRLSAKVDYLITDMWEGLVEL